jgi:hypothetical protein
MKTNRQAIAFGGMILFSGCCVFSASAAAYGPQWRPAPGYAATQGAGFRQIAGAPGFRPQTAAPPGFYQTQHRRLAPQRGYPALVARSPAGYPRHQMPQYWRPGFQAVGPGTSSWMAPPAMMARPWRQPPPGLAQRLDYRPPPAPQHRGGARAVPRQHWQRLPTAPQRLGFRPAGPRGLPSYGSWRPVGQANAAAGAAHPPTSGYTPRLRAHLGHNGDVFRAGPAAAPVGLSPTSLRATYRNWRPVTGGEALPPRSASAFRPMGYGRAAVDTRSVASNTHPLSAAGRARLPGWATTYQDTNDGGLCSWCGGS